MPKGKKPSLFNSPHPNSTFERACREGKRREVIAARQAYLAEQHEIERGLKQTLKYGHSVRA